MMMSAECQLAHNTLQCYVSSPALLHEINKVAVLDVAHLLKGECHLQRLFLTEKSQMDADLALALSLQFNDDDERAGVLPTFEHSGHSGYGLTHGDLGHGEVRSISSAAYRPLSVVDESWEMIDPAPNIHDLFLQFNDAYFDGRLAGVEVKWSSKMTLCAGICSYEGRGGLCSIRLSEPLLKLRPRKDLVQTLLHEMIHALLFVTQNNKDHDSHGPEFHKHMFRINKLSGANITVYHSFHDEVNNYRQHWWKCDGPCKSKPPFFGVVRRSMNRAPSKNDTWWYEHLRTCGGAFHKIKEPKDYGKKSSKRKRDEEKGKECSSSIDGASISKNQVISKWFKPVQNSGRTMIKTISNIQSTETQTKNSRDVFTGTGNSLVSDELSVVVSKDEWIERLMRKQAKFPKGNDNKAALHKENLHPEQGQAHRKVTSIGSLRLNHDREGNCDSKNRGAEYSTFDKKRTPENEVPGPSLGLSLVDNSFAILSSTVSSANSPSTLPLSTATMPSPSATNTLCSSSPVNKWKREKPVTIIDDSSPTQSILEVVDCPACPKKIPIDSINLHLDKCLSRSV